MPRTLKVGEIFLDSFPIFDFDGYTKISGQSSFSVTLFHNNEIDSVHSYDISEIDTSGEYGFSFTPTLLGFWKAEIVVGYNNDFFVSEIDVEESDINSISGVVDTILSEVLENQSKIDTMDALLQRVAGLVHENIFIDNTEYDAEGQLVNARVRLFDSQTNCDAATDGGSETTGLIGVYDLRTVWESLNLYKTFKQTRTSP